MSFSTFIKAILADDMDDLGFKYHKGNEWYKLIDDMIYLNVSARKLSFGGIYLYFNICSLFAAHLDKLPYAYCNDAAMLMTQNILSKGGNIGPLGFLLYYCDEKTAEGMKAIELGKEAFSLAKPILAGVHDLQSCFDAKQQAGYLSRFVYGRKWLCREYTLDDYTESDPDDAYSILCKLGKYEKAADYLKQYLAEFERVHKPKADCSSQFEIEHPEEAAKQIANINKIIQDRKDMWAPYINMAENRDESRLAAILRERYNSNCDLLESKHKIKINRSKVALG